MKLPLRDRFYRHVSPEPMSGCHIWTGSTNNGYGDFRVNNVTCRAHRVAWMLERGPIPGDREIDHLCRNRSCVNTRHMELVDRRTNVLRGDSPSARHARMTHCKRGHEFTPENTIREVLRSGAMGRRCLICRRASGRRCSRPLAA